MAQAVTDSTVPSGSTGRSAAAMFGRFAGGDLASILDAHPPRHAAAPMTRTRRSPAPPPGAASEPTNETLHRSTKSSTCCAPCACRTCAPRHRSCWPPPKHNAGNRPKRYGRCWLRSSPAAKHPPSTAAAKPPGPPPARPSPRLKTGPSDRSRRRPKERCAPSSGSTATRTSSRRHLTAPHPGPDRVGRLRRRHLTAPRPGTEPSPGGGSTTATP